MSERDPHAGGQVLRLGPYPGEAAGLLLLLHGRGATAEDIAGLAEHAGRSDLACWAPQAAGFTWYPHRFLATREANEPWLSSALGRVEALLEEAARSGIGPERCLLAGFSQGACLSLEVAAHRPRPLGAVVAFTGGLIGPPGGLPDYAGSLAGTPVLLAAGDPDPHVPWSRVEESAEVLRGLGATVDVRRYPGLGHAIHPEALALFRQLAGRLGR